MNNDDVKTGGNRTHKKMTENEVEKYREIAVWRERTVRFLLYWLVSLALLIVFVLACHYLDVENDANDTLTGIIAFVAVIAILFLAPLAVASSLYWIICVMRLSASLDCQSGCCLAFVVNLIIPFVFIAYGLYLIVRSGNVLREAGYTDGFSTDLSRFP